MSMYRKIHCDWFLSDGIFAPIRLDAPMYVEDALISSGRICAQLTNEEHMAVEWIYRRAWRYETTFALDKGDRRAFLRLSGLKGRWHVLINGAEAAQGDGSQAVFEISQNIESLNRLEILFDADTGAEIRPVIGFGGMLSARTTGKCAVMRLNLVGYDRLFAALDMLTEGEAELKYSLKNSAGKNENAISQKLSYGYTPLLLDGINALAGEVNEIELSAYCDGKLSDTAALTLYLNDERARPRGFVGESEELISLAENAGAISAFTPDPEPDFSHRLISARHGLESLSADELERYIPAHATLPYERLLELCGSEEQLKKNEYWKLAGADIAVLDAFRSYVPSGDMEKLAIVSRYKQAQKLRQDALDARIGDRCFVVDKVEARPAAPESSALSDWPGHPRPAYYALMCAWQREVGYIKPVSVTDGIASLEVYLATDNDRPAANAVCVNVYDLSGVKVLTNSFPALSQGMVGRFTFELPPEGAAVVRTFLITGEEKTISTDEAVFKENVSFEDLPLTQLLTGEGRVTNVGQAAALGICVPGARYFGCLLPGEYVSATQGDPDEAEGLNIFI